MRTTKRPNAEPLPDWKPAVGYYEFPSGEWVRVDKKEKSKRAKRIERRKSRRQN